MTSVKSETTGNLWLFFLLTFSFSWLVWLPGILQSFRILQSEHILFSFNNVLMWVGGIGPSLAAIILLFRSEGRKGIKKVFSRVLQAKLGFWYLPAFLLLPVILLIAHVLNTLFFSGAWPQTGLLAEPYWIPLVFIIFFVLQFSEELGWRGFALDRLQKKFNALSAGILVGVAWAVWHLPMFFIEGFGQHDNQLPYIQFFTTFVLISILITWLQNNTNGSLVPAFIVHAMINLSGEVLPLSGKAGENDVGYSAWIITNFLLFLTVIIIVRFSGYRKLVRS